MATTEIATSIGRNIRQSWHNFVYGPPQKMGQTETYLPEGAQYLLKYRDEVSIDDITYMNSIPGFNMMAPYFGLKLLDEQPQLQSTLMKAITHTFASGGTFADVSRDVNTFLKPHGVPNPEIIPHKVSAKELSRVATWGPATIDRRAHDVLSSIRAQEQVPVIIGYGGLLALKASIDTTAPGEAIYIVLPKKADTEDIGYKLSRTDEGMTVDKLSQEDLAITTPIALIDDATHTGNTFATVRPLFPHATIQESPLFIT